MSVVTRSIVLVLIVLGFTTAAVAQKGSLSGKVRGEDTKTALVGANVYIPSLGRGAVTNTKGEYKITGIPNGTYRVEYSFVGYKRAIVTIDIKGATTHNLMLKPTILEMGEVVKEVNRAKIRETPIAFTDVGRAEIDERYTTQDVPDLLRLVPGVFTTNIGLGEAGIYIRGFDAEHTQVMINGIPVNDPESQWVYWSNWTGLSGNTSSIQVQRGVGSSLYGSGAFGGSINVITAGMSPYEKLSFRFSGGVYENEGTRDPQTGGTRARTPMNYIASVEYTSGLMLDNKLNFSFRYERKYGESYIRNTRYDGHSFYGAVQGLFGSHKLTFNFIGAPQKHLQARTMQDLKLLKADKLGREYNRYDHPYQENYYFKPQFELHHEWGIDKNQFLATNAFFTTGQGGGRYLRNDYFDVQTGAVSFKTVSEATDNKYFGRNARWIYENTGVVLTGYDPQTKTYNGQTVSRATNLPNGDFSHSWKNDSQNYHTQFGMNTAYQHELNEFLTYTVGGEIRLWTADHYAQSKLFRMSDGQGGVRTINEVQRRYDYTGNVTNMSGFARFLITPIEHLTLMLDGSYAVYTSKVIENPIEIYDFGAQQWTGKYYYATKDMKDSNGNPKYKDSDYERTFKFFQPKIGMNYNLTDNINVLVNYSLAKKEPKTGDWYSRSRGPSNTDLKPETIQNLEFGAAYRAHNITFEANYYRMRFSDKIEYVTNQEGDRETINAGSAVHQGVELSANGRLDNLLFGLAVTKSDNKWQDLEVQKIFGQDKKDVEGKYVPYSPMTMINGEVGWQFGSIPLKIVIGVQFWDDYYASYTNTYDDDGDPNTPEVEAKLPNYLDINARLVYNLNLGTTHLQFILTGNNLTSHDNYTNARYTRDFNRNDNLRGKYYMYVAQAPLRNVFLTAKITM